MQINQKTESNVTQIIDFSLTKLNSDEDENFYIPDLSRNPSYLKGDETSNSFIISNSKDLTSKDLR